MIVKVLLYFFLLLISFSLFLVGTMPAKFAWEQAQKHLPLQGVPLKLSSLSGSIWDGQGIVTYQSVSNHLKWRTDFSGLLTASLPLDIKATGEFANLKGQLVLSPGSVSLNNLTGSANVAEVNGLVKRHRVTLDGELVLNNVGFSFSGGLIERLEGQFSWSGGDISYPAGRQLHKRKMPMFKGRIIEKNGEYALGIRDADSQFDSIEGSLKSDGWAMFQVRRRLLDVAEEAWPANSTEQDTVFKVKRKIF